jgi:hypothetical protein
VSHPDYPRGDKSFIGKLLPGASHQKEENLRVTYIPRQTGIAQTFDINPDILEGFTFYSEGYYEVPYMEDLSFDEDAPGMKESTLIARFETIVPDKEYAGKKIEFLMRAPEITISGKDETDDGPNVFRIPSDWVNAPHLRVRYDKAEQKFWVASFGEKTIVNEIEVVYSHTADPKWYELPLNSRMVLNGIVGVNIFKS